VREQHRGTGRGSLDVLGEHLRLHLVRQQDRDELRTLDGVGHGANVSRSPPPRPGGRALAQAYLDLERPSHAGERMGMALAP